MGKALEVSDAKAKANTSAKKRMIKIPLKEGRTLHHDYEGSFGACKVIIRSAVSGTGVISGGIMRNIFECLGVKDVIAKTIGSNNPYNVIMATFIVLQDINSPKAVADRRGKNINEVIRRRNQLMGIVIENNEEEKKNDK
jgi:small subunit ribosomal protein S5